MKIGSLQTLISVQSQSGQDALGQPSQEWTEIGRIWANIGNETGMASLSTSTDSTPKSIARYSFLVQLADVKRLGIAADMRLVYDGLNFDVRTVIRDMSNRDRAYIMCTQGGDDG